MLYCYWSLILRIKIVLGFVGKKLFGFGMLLSTNTEASHESSQWGEGALC